MEKGLAKAVWHPIARAMPVEMEAQSEEQVEQALGLPILILMLDNFSVPQVRKVLPRIRQRRPDLQVEVSGGVTISNVRAYAKTGVDRISVGAITHSAPALNFSLDIEPA